MIKTYYGHMGYFGWFWMVIFWIGFIWLIIWLINLNKKRDDARSILKRRLARGEISSREYDSLVKKLSK